MPGDGPRNILNVNDNEGRRYLLSHALRRAGFEVTEAETGERALRAAAQTRPDLILLDVRLPDVDGFEVCRRLKAHTTTSAIPVVMVSEVFTDDVDRIEALEIGADGYLTDARPPVMVATIRALLRAREAEEAGQQSERHYRVLFDSTPVPAWVVDLATLRIVAVNEAAVRQLGYSRDEFLRMTLRDFRPQEDVPALLELMASPSRGADDAGIRRYVRKDGSIIEAAVITRRLTYEGRDVRLVIARDVTEQRRAEAIHRAQLEVARILAASRGLNDAGPRVLRAMCEELRWDVGELWSKHDDALRLEACWAPDAFASFEAAARRARLPVGVGLSGRVWTTGEPHWIPDVAIDAGFLRRADAAVAGLHAAVAVPIFASGESTGVMVFFSRDMRPRDPHVLDMMADVGARMALLVERQQAEEALRGAEARYRLALKALHGVVWDWHLPDDRLIVSDAGRTLFRHAPAAMIPRAWWDQHIDAGDRERVRRQLDAIIRGAADGWADEYRFRRRDGTYAQVVERGSVLRDPSGMAVRLIAAVTDVTEQRLRDERDRLRALSLGVLRAREDEARRIARELHDEASQLLGSAHLGLDQLAGQLPSELQARIGLVRARLDEAEGRIRQLAHELRPPVLDDLGLIAALEVLAETVTFRSRLHVEVIATLDHRLSSAVETTLYRVAQEALTNAARHAAATQVTITIARAGALVRCTIRDDGQGFASSPSGTPLGGGLGLIGMRERVEVLGGRLEIVSAPGAGTEIRVEVPADVDDGPADPAG